MSQPRQHPSPRERERVIECLQDLNIARAHLHTARRNTREWDKRMLRDDLLVSLERYAAAIARMGAPVPRRLRTEIALYKGLKNRG
ncbi:hypothetical protein [Nocardioides bigeumensis]|uniref:DUF3263 domain-containing protein n=1 Tax=Nocardioides bigeumensis TaxID=433657 RepID=A0ABN2XMA6_9ACTN